jgi:alkanesulfonate monooxygenase SsuD/methylene tetrahydromethanopterin reductase-like flavin-dependent oxidoreductase (luciferase family)
VHPYGGYCPAPLAFLAAVAGSTRRVRLMTGGVLPVFHHPVQLAGETAMVDALSGGRLDVGFARAYLPYEFQVFGVPIDESRRRFVASVDTIVRLWTEHDVDLQDPFSTDGPVTVLPRPTQAPHPPVWIAASLSPESFGWIGERGFGLLTTSLLTDHGYLRTLVDIYRTARRGGPAGRGRLALSIPLLVRSSEAEARREGDYYLERYLRVWADAAEAWRGVESAAYPGYSRMPDIVGAVTPEQLRQNGGVVFGSPTQVVDAVARLREELGADRILWQVDFGAMPLEASRRTVRAFIDEVVPRLGPRETAGWVDAGGGSVAETA